MITTEFRLLDDKIAVEPEEAAEESEGGIYIPGGAIPPPQRGIVRHVGPGAYGADGKRKEIGLIPGDIVLYSKYNGVDVIHDGRKYIIFIGTTNGITAVIGHTDDPEPEVRRTLPSMPFKNILRVNV